MSKFKVGDIVRWNANFTDYEINRGNSYEVIRVGEIGVIDLKGVSSKQWFPENFELCKNQVVINILNDL